MTDSTTQEVDIAAFYGPLVPQHSLALLLRACDEVEDFRALARRASSARFMIDAIESVTPSTTDLDEWVVKVAAHMLEALVEQGGSRLLASIAHQDFMLGECQGWSTQGIARIAQLRDGTNASAWLVMPTPSSVAFNNILVRDYFIARHIIDGNSDFLLRFEFPKRWVLMDLAFLAPSLLTTIAASRTDRLRAEIEAQVEQRVQAALSHLLKRSAGAVRSHLKSLRKKLDARHLADTSAEFERIFQEVDFQIALADNTRKWSTEPEPHIEDIPLLPEIQSVVAPLGEAFATVTTTIDAASSLMCRCDRQLFREAFHCLAENAFQAASTAAVEPRVDIHARQLDDRLTIRIEILDSGAGVHPDDRDRIFQPQVTTKKGGNGRALGTGMGLPIARKYAELMSGHIGIDTRASATCFFFELPASPASAP